MCYLCCDHLPRPLWVRILVSETQHHLVSWQVSTVKGKILKFWEKKSKNREGMQREKPTHAFHTHRLKHTVNITRHFPELWQLFLETTDGDDGNVIVKWHRKHHLVILRGGPQEVGGDSTHFGSLLRMWLASLSVLPQEGLTQHLHLLHHWH